MGLNDILLRETVNPNLSAKGAELTFGEGDANLIEIYNYLVSLNAGGTGIDVYNAGTTYTGTAFVSYDGNIYKHIAGSSVGVTPGTDPLTWEITSIGELAHEKNKDQYLDYGGASQVDAASVYDIVVNQAIGTTSAAFAALFVAGTVKKNRWYRITDYSYFSVAHTLYVLSLNSGSETGVSPIGFLRAVLPLSSFSLWVPGGTYSVGGRVAWKNKVWRNLTGSNTTTEPDDDGTNWVLEANTAYYRYAFFKANVKISSVGVASIISVTDYNGNEFSVQSYLEIDQNSGTVKNNRCDNESILSLPNIGGTVTGNIVECGGSLTGGYSNSGTVKNNKIVAAHVNLGSLMSGTLENSILEKCTTTFPDYYTDVIDGLVIRGDGVGFVFHFALGELSDNVVIDKNGSTQEKTITSMALAVNCKHVGVFNVNATASYTAMTGDFPVDFPFIIKPTNGNTTTLTFTNIGSATYGQFVGNGASVVLEGSKGEYAKVQYRVINGIGVLHVLENNQIS